MLSGHKEKAIENYRRATRDRSNDGKREASVEEVKGAVRGYQQIAQHSRAATKATRPLTHTKNTNQVTTSPNYKPDCSGKTTQGSCSVLDC